MNINTKRPATLDDRSHTYKTKITRTNLHLPGPAKVNLSHNNNVNFDNSDNNRPDDRSERTHRTLLHRFAPQFSLMRELRVRQ